MAKPRAQESPGGRELRGRVVDAPVAIGGPAWWNWLDAADTRSFRFEASSGTFTARRELRNGTGYWYAYRKSAQHLRKAYLGRSSDLSGERLEHVATQLTQRDPKSNSSDVQSVASRMWAAGSLLPAPVSTFIGREEELTEVRRLLRRARLVTLTGVAGVGKTRLALEAVRAVARSYRDHARFVELAPLADPGLVTHTVAAAVGVQEQPGRDGVLGALLNALVELEVVLVIDNCEHVLDGVAPLVDRITAACPEVRIVATSRERLNVDGEIVWPVPPLAVHDPVAELDTPEAPDAVRLFVERAAAVQPGLSLTIHNAAQVAQICGQLDGLPLAIELAAARVPVLGLKGLETMLQDRFRVLRSRSRTRTARQQTLRAALDWSYELLQPHEQRAFDQLSVFAGGWTLEAAKAVCDSVGETSVIDVLEALREKSLLTTEPQVEGADVRFGMLESLRQYGSEHLTGSGEAPAVQARHAAYVTNLAEQLERRLQGPGQPICLRTLEHEHDNLRAALRWTLDAGDGATALRLAAALARFWLIRGHMAEGRDWLERALALRDRCPDQARIRALWGAAALTYPMGALARAEELAQEALAMAREIGDEGGQAQALHHLAWIRAGHDQAVAIAFAREGLSIARVHGDAWLIAVLANTFGAMLAVVDATRAAALYSEGVHLAELAGDALIEGTLLRNLGELALDRGDAAEAERLNRRSLHAAGAAGSPRQVAPSLEYLGRAALARGLGTRSARLFGAADHLRTRAGFVVNLLDAGPYADAIRHLQTQLGDEVFAAAWAEGRAWSMEEAIKYALTDDPEISPPARLLTPREAEVATLVAGGLTNRQIAERLVISERTVERHLENAYARLGYTSRAQLAVWASQQHV